MKLRKPSFIGFMACSSFLLLSFALFYSINLRGIQLENARNFHHQYLSAHQHALDLVKNLNAYEDFLYSEIKSFRDRDALFYQNKIISSFDLLFSKKVFKDRKKTGMRESLDDLLEKSNMVLTHLQNDETNLARRIFTREFEEDKKSFLIRIDSHKKFLQNKTNLFFSKNMVSAGEFDRQGPIWGAVLFFLSAFSLTGLWLSWKKKENILLAQRRDLASKAESLVNELFDKNQALKQVKEALLETVEEEIKFQDLGATLKSPPLPSGQSFKKQVDQAAKLQEGFALAAKERFVLLEKEIEKLSILWERAGNCFSNLSKAKIELINLGLKGSGPLGGSAFLDLLTELASIFKDEKRFSDFSESKRKTSVFESNALAALDGVKDSAQALIDDLRRAIAANEESWQFWESSLDKEKQTFQQKALKRKERLVQALVLIDGEQEIGSMGRDDEKEAA